MNTKAESLYRQERKRDHEHIQREIVNTKIVRIPGGVSYVREKRERREIMNTKVEGTSEPMLRRDAGREAEIL
jgi:hypothetical protein